MRLTPHLTSISLSIVRQKIDNKITDTCNESKNRIKTVKVTKVHKKVSHLMSCEEGKGKKGIK